jgi:hypothetical protein
MVCRQLYENQPIEGAVEGAVEGAPAYFEYELPALVQIEGQVDDAPRDAASAAHHVVAAGELGADVEAAIQEREPQAPLEDDASISGRTVCAIVSFAVFHLGLFIFSSINMTQAEDGIECASSLLVACFITSTAELVYTCRTCFCCKQENATSIIVMNVFYSFIILYFPIINFTLDSECKAELQRDHQLMFVFVSFYTWYAIIWYSAVCCTLAGYIFAISKTLNRLEHEHGIAV